MKLYTHRSVYAATFGLLLSLNVSSAIKIGLVLPLSGPLAATGMDIVAGTKAAVETLNKNGGIKGQLIELIIEDDRFDPKLSEELARTMVKTKGVDGFLSCFGTVSCLAVAKVAQETGTPLLGPIAGTEALRDEKLSKVYSIRANASQEIAALLKYSTVINPDNTAVIVQDDGFGKAYANSLKAVSTQANFKPMLQILFDPKAPNYPNIASQIIATKQDPAILLIANTVHSVGITKALNEAKYLGQLLNLAGQANAGYLKGLANANQMSVFVTMTPSPFSVKSLAASAYQTQWQQVIGNDNFSYIGFESFLNAQVLIAALRKSASFSTKGIDLAISQMSKVSIYEMNYTFAGNQRQSSNYTDMAVMSKGSFKH